MSEVSILLYPNANQQQQQKNLLQQQQKFVAVAAAAMAATTLPQNSAVTTLLTQDDITNSNFASAIAALVPPVPEEAVQQFLTAQTVPSSFCFKDLAASTSTNNNYFLSNTSLNSQASNIMNNEFKRIKPNINNNLNDQKLETKVDCNKINEDDYNYDEIDFGDEDLDHASEKSESNALKLQENNSKENKSDDSCSDSASNSNLLLQQNGYMMSEFSMHGSFSANHYASGLLHNHVKRPMK